ncbi:cilia- and flagella-associated protein 97-like [Schistocerca cancellata]|uniref:cilia- and flagella-associated protein 97-like n=1 Tax=Schistocerca cancellata TaxID=274614 RepID=UPI0021189C79|nr:cilia- and flagella-associated protein 97-like [Schistocerca cancellata]
MSIHAGGVSLQETAEVLTNLRIGQEMEAVDDFYDSNANTMCGASQKGDSKLQGKCDNRHERPKFSAKKVTINIADDAKCKTTRAGAVKDLMNCIAFQKEPDEFNDDERTSPDFLSTDTSSDVTDVTPRSTTSGCSSLSRSEESRESRKKITERSHSSDAERKEEKKPVHTLRFLREVLDSTNAETVDRNNGATPKRKPVICKNMTFSKDQVRKIDRENQILLRKIEANFNRRPKCPTTSAPQRPRLSSSAVNRQRSQKKIAQDNLTLLKKIECVKSTISARVSVRKV